MATTPKQDAEVLRKVRTWLIDSGVTLASVEHLQEGVSHHLTFRFPPEGPTGFDLVRLKGRGLTVLATGTTVSPQHLDALQAGPPQLRQHVVRTLRRVAFQGGVVGFGPELKGDVVTRWRLDVEVFDDGLSQQNFFDRLRALLSKHLDLLDAFNDALGTKLSTETEGATGSAGYIR